MKSRRRILERAQEIAGGEPLFLLPVCEIDWEGQSYVPAESAYGGCTWSSARKRGSWYRLAETFSPDPGAGDRRQRKPRPAL